jgi:tRNA threonylcarbamoyl adenosine modification protein (Sua5/YciO/YrdC/YwlC family)
MLRVDPRQPDPDVVGAAVAALARGDLVILPTETVYGVAADPRAPGAVEKIFPAKGRSPDKAVTLLAADEDQVRRQGAEFPPAARALAARYWPGPLTLVLKAGREFVGFRVPAHAVALDVLRKAGSVLAVTSANRSGEPPARVAADAARALGSAVALSLDAGPSAGGVPSTVVRVDDARVDILREGAISSREILETVAA